MCSTEEKKVLSDDSRIFSFGWAIPLHYFQHVPVSHLPTGLYEDLLLRTIWVEDLVKLKLTRSSRSLQDHRVVIKTSNNGLTSSCLFCKSQWPYSTEYSDLTCTRPDIKSETYSISDLVVVQKLLICIYLICVLLISHHTFSILIVYLWKIWGQ